MGEFISEKKGNRTGGELPISLLSIYDNFDELRFNPTNKTSMANTIDSLNIKLEPEKSTFVGFENTAVFSPVPYIPAATGILMSKLTSDSVLIAYYLACLCTLIFSIAILRLAMLTLPQGNILVLTFSLLPMFMFELASLSSDSLSNSISILFICQIFSIVTAHREINKRFIVQILISGALLALCKQTYSVLFLLTALIVPRFFENWLNCARYQILFCSTMLLVISAWQYVVSNIYSPLSWVKGANAKLQLKYIVDNPILFIETVWMDLAINYKNYILLMGGALLGWVDTQLPFFIIGLHLVILIILAYSLDFSKFLTIWQYVIIIVTIILGVLIIELALYLHAQPVASTRIIGVHGRYFLHLAFILLMMISTLPKIFTVNSIIQLGLVSVCFVAYLVSVPIIISRYYY